MRLIRCAWYPVMVVGVRAADAPPAAAADVGALQTGLVIAVSLFAGMIALLEFGRRLGVKRLARDTEGARAGTGAVDGAVFALLGLLLAFTFSGAASRYDTRRQLIVQEANAIGTAWLRLDPLPATAQPALREAFRGYLDARLRAYSRMPDFGAAERDLQEALLQQQRIWELAVATVSRPEGQGWAMLLLPALNEMFDIASIRTAALRMHPPRVVYGLLLALALASALLAGFGMSGAKRRSWIHIAGFALIISGAVYVIHDLEHPRAGLIRVGSADHLLVDLRRDMEP